MVTRKASALTYVGLGPAGTGPLVAAAQSGTLDALLSDGIQFIDKGPQPGSGKLGRYALHADSSGCSFLEATDRTELLRSLAVNPAAAPIRALEPFRHSHPPLRLVAKQIDLLGDAIAQRIRASESSELHTETTAQSIHLRSDGSVCVRAHSAQHKEIEFVSRGAVLALGASCRSELPPDLASRPFSNRVVTADQLLQVTGLDRAECDLQTISKPRVVILGGSHSAYSAAWRLLQSRRIEWAESSISIFQRRDPAVFYPDAEQAHQDRYAFTERDVCPLTRRIHRLGGLRGDGRELYRSVIISGQERRVSIRPISERDELYRQFEAADLIVVALGYQPRTVPIFGADGRPLELASATGGRHVDENCRLRLAAGGSTPNLYGIGLASGFIPDGEMGGEPSFQGETNGVWLYQNAIGERLLQSLRSFCERAA